MEKILSRFYISILVLISIFPQGRTNADSQSSVSRNTSDSKIEQILPTSPDKDSPWGTGPERFQEMEILDLVDEASSQRRWKEANKEYSIAIEGFEIATKSVAKKREEAKSLVYYEDRYDWQRKARNETREKEFQKTLSDARNQAVLRLIKAMAFLDKIENPKVKSSEPYLDLKSGLYREYIKHQDAFKNYMQSADFLERYISLSEKNEKEAEPHRLLALSYEKLEFNATKGKNPSIAEEWRESKKKHLLRFAELHYGRESKEFTAIEEKIARDI
ncbi:hypothetical protein LPTSP3_g17020 [Leptospira kobayashii]|uniref:Uncharacterized protein n=1 Tax=Leptospira kobayashii TaxID=1917830 RepID=A0ABM7UIZ7_9LEPT|nr:hypothetical protein [Leptospira kobayashii]BDA78772.1 hypothetical protein LPTSP3_g17020 [Leptospira kobayashii]